MLDTQTKQKINALRDILVGKIPDPKAQVEQITLALMYKFMSDIDEKNVELGGRSAFFVDDYASCSWRSLTDPALSGHERVLMYSECLVKMSHNPGIPQLFRDIFKQAFLPYRDPEVLTLFFKHVSDFEYTHSEKLGDAFEYLLSVLGSQGDAGQFRTPRHIIDFIVEVIDPLKTDTVLDPACGTAGFLISAYKHILKRNTEDGSDREGSALSSGERQQISRNFTGYDISPDMIRLSLVNMYLHNFTNPKIREYDSLTSDTYWDEDFDVILANPPFMTPKGGIRPHNRFGIKANRAEVLFVDYIMEHLKPGGRAGIIVPDGILYQSSLAYRSLRKTLIETAGLWAVISLPAGVFQPYSPVKTSILFLDKNLARKMNGIAFFQVRSDGYDLDVQRRESKSNDLPRLAQQLLEIRTGHKMSKDCLDTIHVSKDELLSNNEYSLLTESYGKAAQKEGVTLLEDVAEVFNGVTYRKDQYLDSGALKVIKVRDYDEKGVYFTNGTKGWVNSNPITEKYLKKGDTLIINAAHNASHVASKIGFCRDEPPMRALPSGEILIVRPKDGMEPLLMNYIIRSSEFKSKLKTLVKGIHLYPKDVKKLPIFLPGPEEQKKIVEKIGSYQKEIDEAELLIQELREKISSEVRVVIERESEAS